jgi:hypothetical protein
MGRYRQWRSVPWPCPAACNFAEAVLCACYLPHLAPACLQLTVGQLLPWTRDQLLKDRPELFMKGDTV